MALVILFFINIGCSINEDLIAGLDLSSCREEIIGRLYIIVLCVVKRNCWAMFVLCFIIGL